MPTHAYARDNRWFTATRVAVASSPSFANLSTAITSLVLVPTFQLLLFVAIASTAGSPQLVTTGYTGVLVVTATSMISGTIVAVTQDRQLGVLIEVLASGHNTVACWWGKVAAPLLLTLPTALLLLGGLLALDPAHRMEPWWAALRALPLAAMVGALIGVTAASFSIAFKDPYLVSNVVILILPVTAGVMAPIADYPLWLACLARALPLTATVEAFRGMSAGDGGTATLTWVGVEALITSPWLILGWRASRRVLRLLRSGRRDEDPW